MQALLDSLPVDHVLVTNSMNLRFACRHLDSGYRNRFIYIKGSFDMLELLVCAYPIGMVIVKSFTNWDGMFKSDPVGLRNYIRIFSDPNFWTLLNHNMQ